MRLDFLVKLKYHSSTLIINILCVTYFVTSLSELDPYASHMINVSAPSGIGSPEQEVNFITKNSFRWKFM